MLCCNIPTLLPHFCLYFAIFLRELGHARRCRCTSSSPMPPNLHMHGCKIPRSALFPRVPAGIRLRTRNLAARILIARILIARTDNARIFASRRKNLRHLGIMCNSCSSGAKRLLRHTAGSYRLVEASTLASRFSSSC